MTEVRFIVPFGTQQEFAAALADKLHGQHVETAAYSNPFAAVGLLFEKNAPAFCLECSVFHYLDTIRVYVYLGQRARASVDLLTVVPGYAARYTYPETADIDELAQNVAGRFWERINSGPKWE